MQVRGLIATEAIGALIVCQQISANLRGTPRRTLADLSEQSRSAQRSPSGEALIGDLAKGVGHSTPKLGTLTRYQVRARLGRQRGRASPGSSSLRAASEDDPIADLQAVPAECDGSSHRAGGPELKIRLVAPRVAR